MTFDSSNKAIDLGNCNILGSGANIPQPFGRQFAARILDRANTEGGLTETGVLVVEEEANLVEVLRYNLEREAFI